MTMNHRPIKDWILGKLLRQCGIRCSKDKKEMIGQYSNAQMESKWLAFDSYKPGSWEDFKKDFTTMAFL
jgi:hypothetical protein